MPPRLAASRSSCRATTRRADTIRWRKTLEIEFVIHEAGPATRWAEQARPGQTLRIGGPRGSFIIPTNFDWHLLIGDDTALPAIARRLAELPAGTRAVVLAEVDGPADQVAFQSAADVTVTWAHGKGVEPGTSDVLARTLKTLQPAGGGLLRLGRVRVAHRQSAARAADRRPWRQSEVDALPPAIGGAVPSPCMRRTTIRAWSRKVRAGFRKDDVLKQMLDFDPELNLIGLKSRSFAPALFLRAESRARLCHHIRRCIDGRVDESSVTRSAESGFMSSRRRWPSAM